MGFWWGCEPVQVAGAAGVRLVCYECEKLVQCPQRRRPVQASAGENASVEPRARELAKGSIHSPTRTVRQEHSSPPFTLPPIP